jgi:large subunit ribosomal protein L32
MAVQKSRVSHSKTRMKRAHAALANPTLSTDPTSGEVHRRHHITKLGYLKGKKVLDKNPSE